MTVIAAVGIIVPLLVGVFAYFAKAWIVPRRRTCSPTSEPTRLDPVGCASCR